MSGPKYSTAYIREQQRLQMLAKQLEEQLEKSKMKQVMDDIQRLEEQRQQYCEISTVVMCKRAILEAEQLIPDSPALKQMKDCMEVIKRIQQNHCDTTGTSTELLRNYQSLQTEMLTLDNTVSMLRTLKRKLSAEGTAALQTQKMKEFENMEWVDTREKIETVPTDLQELYYEVLGVLVGTNNYEKDKEIIDQTIMNSDFDVDYKKKQLRLRKNAIEVEKNRSQNNLDILTKINQLKGIYKLLGWEEKEVPADKNDLEKAISQGELLLEHKQHAAYISGCIHRVFQEKGYSLLDDSILESKSGLIEKDYFEFGEDSLINVSMSDKGQMLFEVVGNGMTKEMDASRAAGLECEMKRFCPNYQEIKEALEKDYGIFLEQEHLCQPDKKYAKAVDVTVKEDSRRKKEEKKMMHYDD